MMVSTDLFKAQSTAETHAFTELFDFFLDVVDLTVGANGDLVFHPMRTCFFHFMALSLICH